MTDLLPIKAFRVEVLDHAGGVVKQQELVGGPSNKEDALVTYSIPGHGTLTSRLKGHDGKSLVRFRPQAGALIEADAVCGRDLAMNTPAGQFRVRISELPKERWTWVEVYPFRPPHVRIEAVQGGYKFTFTPDEQDATFTVSPADKTKPVSLPSVPFPSVMGFTSASMLVSTAEGASAGVDMRLGIRGSGRECVVPLPANGNVLDVVPAQFIPIAGGDASKFGPAETKAKYDEKLKEGTRVQYAK
jgi:hypothetical protein